MLHENTAPAAANRPGEWNTMEVPGGERPRDGGAERHHDMPTTSFSKTPATVKSPPTPRVKSCSSEARLPSASAKCTSASCPPTPRFELSPEEAAEGFEVLFDGTLDAQVDREHHQLRSPSTERSTSRRSTAASGNLYTKKEYGDFILRFEFALRAEKGVNNGIGIRTPMGVDAAYHGMEIQMLDHDAPIYKNLRVYQQHGSVYGIIPAKRVKFPPLGTWNVEEIRAVGDRITVTVNGEVILDGDIREACQGHNVAPRRRQEEPLHGGSPQPPGVVQRLGTHRTARTRPRHQVPQHTNQGTAMQRRSGICPPPSRRSSTDRPTESKPAANSGRVFPARRRESINYNAIFVPSNIYLHYVVSCLCNGNLKWNTRKMAFRVDKSLLWLLLYAIY